MASATAISNPPPYMVEVKGQLDRQLHRFSGGRENPAEIMALPDPSQVVWKFTRDLPPDTLIFMDDDAPLMAEFYPQTAVKREPCGGFKVKARIVSRKFPYTRVLEDKSNCRVETVHSITSRTRFDKLKGQMSVRTIGAVQKGDVVSVTLVDPEVKIYILCDKSGTDRLESLCKQKRPDLQHPICFIPFPFFDTINLHYRLIF